MSIISPSAGPSLLHEIVSPEEETRCLFNSSRSSRKKKKISLQRTLSSPSSGSSYRHFRFSDRPSRSLTCPSSSSYNSYRSLRTGDSPKRLHLFSPRWNRYKTSRANRIGSDSCDFINKSQSTNSSRQTLRPISLSNSNQNDIVNTTEHNFDFILTGNNRIPSNPVKSTVKRCISSPAGLQPSYVTHSQFIPPNTISTPGRFNYVPVHSHNNLNQENTHLEVDSTVLSPSISISDDFQGYLFNEEDGQSRAANSVGSLYSSRNSVRLDLNTDINSVRLHLEDQSNEGTLFSRHQLRLEQSLENNHLWQNINSGNVLEEEQDGRPRLSQLAFSHMASRDINSFNFHSPPPSYDKLCNPESLPTYQEALEGDQINFKRLTDRTFLFALPSTPDVSISSSHDRLFLQELERSQSGNLMNYSLEESETECDYNTILDAIPQHQMGDSWPEVSISFNSNWTQFRHLRRKLLCSKSICNKELVKRELNSRWPFIIRAREDARCPGLLFVECSSNLSITQLPESRHNSDWNSSLQTSGESARLADHFEPLYFGNDGSTVDVEESAFNNNLMFYLCGKCVFYDSFDCESVKSHIELDCTGHLNYLGHTSELYLLIRAIVFVLVIIIVIMALPLG